jgi:hypothetical protein
MGSVLAETDREKAETVECIEIDPDMGDDELTDVICNKALDAFIAATGERFD